jgi:hypothetical protein
MLRSAAAPGAEARKGNQAMSDDELDALDCPRGQSTAGTPAESEVEATATAIQLRLFKA